MTTTQNQTEIFTALQTALAKVGIKVATLSNGLQPYIGSAFFNGTEGYYFKRSSFGNWTQGQELTIASIFPFKHDGNVVTLGSINAMDDDGDRYWNAMFTFAVEVDYDALAERDKAQRDYESGKRLY
jgi:ABC-type transport system substrate-binding protein